MAFNSAPDFVDWVGEAEAVDLAPTDSGTPDLTKIAEALDQAQAQILSKLSGRYPPDRVAASPSKELKLLELQLARWGLDQTNLPRDFVFEGFKFAIRRLERVAEGKEDLDLNLGDFPNSAPASTLPFNNSAVPSSNVLGWN